MLDEMFKFFFKVMLYIMVFVLIMAAAILFLTHIPLFVGILVGAVFSPHLYTFIEKRFDICFPDFVKFQVTELLGVLDIGKEEFDRKTDEMNRKRKEVDNIINELKLDVQSIKHEYLSLKNSGGKSLFDAEKTESERMKKAIRQVLGNPRWVQRLGDMDEKNFFENMKM